MGTDMPLPAQTPSHSLGRLAQRRHWTVANGRATFAPVPTGWRAIVSRLQDPTSSARYHVSVLDRTGTARFASETTNLKEAIHNAERGVLARNALALAPRG